MIFKQDIITPLIINDGQYIVRLTTSDSPGERLPNYGDCNLYIHLQTDEETINEHVYDQVKFIKEDLERQIQKNRKDRLYKVRILPKSENGEGYLNISMYIRRNGSVAPLSMDFLIELLEKILDYLSEILFRANEGLFNFNSDEVYEGQKEHTIVDNFDFPDEDGNIKQVDNTFNYPDETNDTAVADDHGENNSIEHHVDNSQDFIHNIDEHIDTSQTVFSPQVEEIVTRIDDTTTKEIGDRIYIPEQAPDDEKFFFQKAGDGEGDDFFSDLDELDSKKS